MKKLLLIILLCLVSLSVGVVVSLAQENASSQSASEVPLTFPISELGNCSSASDCKSYCDDPTHIDACVAYAKEKGFYKESSLDNSKDEVLADAKTTLGCDSLDSCRTFCQQAANATACSDFAQKHNLRGGKKQLDSTTLAKAEAAFGCTSADSCKTFCQQEDNQEKCASFAKENNLKGGNQTVGPGGCTSEASCKTFCSNPDNFQTCSQFVEDHGATGSAQKSFTGPGGCTSESACKSYCDQNPTACHLNPEGKLIPMSATAAAHLEDRNAGQPHQNIQGPSGQSDHNAGDSGTIMPQQGQNNHGPLPSGFQQGQPGQQGEGGQHTQGSGQTGEQEGHGGQQNNTVFPPIPQQTVKAAETQKDIFTWLLDEFFHFK